jgi:tRNA-dihydrouridine synthase 3
LLDTFGTVPLLSCRGDRVEKARLYKAANESCFGVQIATNNIAEGVKAAAAAQAAGASWIDINCGCPIYGETLCWPVTGEFTHWKFTY